MKLPTHVAIVMDGNGRWATRQNLPRIAGHEEGANAVKRVIESCVEKKITILTLFAFGQDNWSRPADEVNYLMGLLLETLDQQADSLHENNIQLRVIGDRARLNALLLTKINQTEQLTADNTGLKLIIALNYSGRWDITNAAKKLAAQVEAGDLRAEDITETHFHHMTELSDVPPPDLFIRTSGEQRVSNFMLWQIAYSEFYFTDTLWPDFDANEFQSALEEFNARERRYGLTTEQLQQEPSQHA